MMRIEEMIAVPAAPAQAIRTLVSPARLREWVAPDVTVTPRTAAPTLGPGDHLRLELLGSLRFDYVVEGVSDREVLFAFDGPWRGRERWSFVADGAETLVRRVYEVDERSPLGALAWRTAGWALVSAHYKLELARFRAAVARDPGPRAEIEPPPTGATPPTSPPPGSASPPPDTPPFPVDDG